VELVCDRIAILAAGRLMALGRLSDLVQPGQNLERYFIDLVQAQPGNGGAA
jgi:ABC-type multidrug transport system ATPase subunit